MNEKMIRIALSSIVSMGLLAGCGEPEEHEVTEPDALGTVRTGILGADLCKDVDLTFVNSRERAAGNVAIRVRRVKFFSEQDDRWRSEDFDNRIVNYGGSVTVDNQDLENVYFEDLIDWKVYYNVLQSDGTWGPEVYQEVTYPFSPRCENYRGYSLTVN